MWWFLGDIVLVVHILLWLFLGAGLVVAVAGWMQRYRKLALTFWLTMVVTLVSLAVPGCILSDLERWLRQIEVPGWSREMSLARTVSGTVIGYHPPNALFTVVGVLLFALAAYAFVRYHLRDVITLLQRGNR